MALQLLVENVIKHNVISDKEPMLVKIRITEDNIEIENPLKIKKTSQSSYNLGLANIEKRYQILSSKKFEIIKTESIFKVRLPLLTIEK